MNAGTTSNRTTLPPNVTLLRWKTLIDLYGSQTAALESLLRESEQLERLKRAVRAHGLDPDALLRETATPQLA